ncbi:hypothetical protein AHAS_Ahas04G0101900 [Arachis hypogaea]
MMHICPMQAMSTCVGLHPAVRHYLGTIGARLDPLIYAHGETMIFILWASPRSTHNKHDPQFVGYPRDQ